MPDSAFPSPPEHVASPRPDERESDRDSLEIESAWGTLTVLFLYQAFGVIVSHALVLFLAPLLLVVVQNDWGGLWFAVFWIAWGAVWVLMFLIPMSQFLDEARRFFAARGLEAFMDLDSPWERVKVLLAPLGLAAAVICLFAYPFPAPLGHSPVFTLLFLAVTSLIAAVRRRKGGGAAGHVVGDEFWTESDPWEWVVGMIVSLVFCGIAVWVVGRKHPPAFPVFGTVAFGLLLLRLQSMLVRRSFLPQRTHDAGQSLTERCSDAENPASGLSDRP